MWMSMTREYFFGEQNILVTVPPNELGSDLKHWKYIALWLYDL